MIRIENVEIIGWEHAIRGMRNPLNSWEKSDSFCDCEECHKCPDNQKCGYYFSEMNTGNPYRSTKRNFHYIGPNDLDLMKRLRNAGTDHRKFMRMITVYADITAPLYWWKEFDTYKVGTVANSCSTMHKIQAKEFTLEDFSHEHLFAPLQDLRPLIDILNMYREMYLETKDKQDWWQLIQLLPTSYNQKRTVMLNYEVFANMYKSRKDHKLDEWREFCKWIETLPYSFLITGEETE